MAARPGNQKLLDEMANGGQSALEFAANSTGGLAVRDEVFAEVLRDGFKSHSPALGDELRAAMAGMTDAKGTIVDFASLTGQSLVKEIARLHEEHGEAVSEAIVAMSEQVNAALTKKLPAYIHANTSINQDRLKANSTIRYDTVSGEVKVTLNRVAEDAGEPERAQSAAFLRSIESAAEKAGLRGFGEFLGRGLDRYRGGSEYYSTRNKEAGKYFDELAGLGQVAPRELWDIFSPRSGMGYPDYETERKS
ncbi:MAG: hypothetical protein Q7S80_02090 [bacterium]|nr:hypothetical protein [bacterium]